MAFETVRDVVEFLKKFHRDLASALDAAGAKWSDEKKRILLNFVGRHQKNMEASLADYEEEVGSALLGTWIKYVPSVPDCRCFEKIEWNQDMSVEALASRVREVDTCLLKLYRQLAEKAPTPEIRELFEGLLQKEETESVRTLRDALSFFEQN